MIPHISFIIFLVSLDLFFFLWAQVLKDKIVFLTLCLWKAMYSLMNSIFCVFFCFNDVSRWNLFKCQLFLLWTGFLTAMHSTICRWLMKLVDLLEDVSSSAAWRTRGVVISLWCVSSQHSHFKTKSVWKGCLFTKSFKYPLSITFLLTCDYVVTGLNI